MTRDMGCLFYMWIVLFFFLKSFWFIVLSWIFFSIIFGMAWWLSLQFTIRATEVSPNRMHIRCLWFLDVFSFGEICASTPEWFSWLCFKIPGLFTVIRHFEFRDCTQGPLECFFFWDPFYQPESTFTWLETSDFLTMIFFFKFWLL